MITNAHLVNGCKRITAGDAANNQSPAQLIATDNRNDLALVLLSLPATPSAETKAPVSKLGIKIVRKGDWDYVFGATKFNHPPDKGFVLNLNIAAKLFARCIRSLPYCNYLS